MKACKKYGFHVQPAALQAMLQYEPSEESSDYLIPILLILQDKLATSSLKIVTPVLWQEAIQEYTATLARRDAKRGETSVSTVAAMNTGMVQKQPKGRSWTVIDSFHTPRLVYDSLRQQFYYKSTAEGGHRPSLFGTVDDKIDMMTQRFLQAQQRVARKVSHLTCIDRLLGSSATSVQTLLGILHATSSSAVATKLGAVSTGLELEDTTGTVPLCLHSKSKVDTMGLYTDGSLVLVQGQYDNGILIVDQLTLPPVEEKIKTQPYLPPFPSKLLGPVNQGILEPLTIYSMANVTLNDPATTQKLEYLVERLSSEEGSSEDAVLVLMGDFTSDSLPLSSAMDELSHILEPLPKCHSVLIMPGPNDTPSNCWPIPAIKTRTSFSQNLNANVEFVSNPCRLDYGIGTQQILLFRDDVTQHYLCNELPFVQSDANTSRSDKHSSFSRVMHTILSQGHIQPKAATYWNYDHALGVYPLPDLILVGLEPGDTSVKAHQEAGCQIVAPGSQGNWVKVTLRGKPGRRTSRATYKIEVSHDNLAADDDDNYDDDMPAEFMRED